MKRYLFLILYYGLAYWLPDSYFKFGGIFFNWCRVACVKRIFAKCGNIRTINRGVNFHMGRYIEMGDDSGIGANVDLPEDTVIGKNVMISRNVFILNRNHRYDRLDIPIH